MGARELIWEGTSEIRASIGIDEGEASGRC